MKTEPILAVMAAGMGSRYGGLKQVDPVGKNGEILMDYALYDAYRAGFRRVAFILKPEMQEAFHAQVGKRHAARMEVAYVQQRLHDLPEGYGVPAGRTKPWGTGHAVLACRKIVDAPFAVINADDFYGAQAFMQIYRFLRELPDNHAPCFCMAGYHLANTLTENGHVARGVCEVRDGLLTSITEHTHIEKRADAVVYTQDGTQWHALDPQAIVSMNLWGFTPAILPALDAQFRTFLDRLPQNDPLKAEFFLPTVVNTLLEQGKASVRVLVSGDRWYGMTYRQDKPVVCKAIAQMVRAGKYPPVLWE